jgi:hypothetical protein
LTPVVVAVLSTFIVSRAAESTPKMVKLKEYLFQKLRSSGEGIIATFKHSCMGTGPPSSRGVSTSESDKNSLLLLLLRE